MKRIKITPSGPLASQICMGGSSPRADYLEGTKKVHSYLQTFECALEHEINFFDSAEAYGNGKAEALLGEFINPIREQVVVSSKASVEHASKPLLQKACEQSLKRLKTDYVDLYYLHYPNPDVPLGESISALMSLKEQGKIRAIGLSNVTVDQLKQARTYGDIDVIQQCYSLVWRRYSEEYLFPYCTELGITMITYGPLASGLLSGAYTVDESFSANDQRARRSSKDGLVPFLPEYFSDSIKTMKDIHEIAKAMGVSLPALAIAWVIEQIGVDGVIIGARNCTQLTENLKSLTIQLSKEDLKRIRQLSESIASRFPNTVNYYSRMSYVWN